MMLFFLSPSKTMKTEQLHELSSEPLFADIAAELRQQFENLTAEQLQHQFKLSAKQACQLQRDYQIKQPVAAIDLYQGSVFKQLQPEGYNVAQRAYLQSQVVILSAVYGYVRPFDAVRPYRLDLKHTMTYQSQSLTKFWHTQITPLVQEEVCINLASSEFARVLPKTVITIDFVESFEQGKAKRLATYAKIARGQLLHACITQLVETPEQLKILETQRYHYSAKDSTPTHYVFSKKANQ
ncbi:MAG: YaaA family protein [Culicoidibacterales bacterium]